MGFGGRSSIAILLDLRASFHVLRSTRGMYRRLIDMAYVLDPIGRFP